MPPSKAPKIGGMDEREKPEVKEPWTGDKPNVGWTGLAQGVLTTRRTPNQFRPTDMRSMLTSYRYRKTGPETKFAVSDDLPNFRQKVWTHLKDTGMDSIAYLPDPAQPSEMVDVIKFYHRFTTDSARVAHKALAPNWDAYDTENCETARTYLLDSLDDDLLKNVNLKIKDDDPFMVCWLQVVHKVLVTSAAKYEALKKQIENRLPSQYPGQNIELLVADLITDTDELMNAGQYEHRLTKKILEILLLANGGKQYDFDLRSLSGKLDKALKEVQFKDQEGQDKHMTAEGLTSTLR